MPPFSEQDYFAVFGLARRMNIEPADLEKRFYDLSRKLHPDNFYWASKEDQASSLVESARLNDAYRTLRDPFARAEYLLVLEGYPIEKKGSGVPPELVAEVFELKEWLAEMRATAAESASDARRAEVQQQLAGTKATLEQRLQASLVELQALFLRWDQAMDSGRPAPERNAVLEGMGRVLARQKYLESLAREVAMALDTQRIENGNWKIETGKWTPETKP